MYLNKIFPFWYLLLFRLTVTLDVFKYRKKVQKNVIKYRLTVTLDVFKFSSSISISSRLSSRLTVTLDVFK